MPWPESREGRVAKKDPADRLLNYLENVLVGKVIQDKKYENLHVTPTVPVDIESIPAMASGRP